MDTKEIKDLKQKIEAKLAEFAIKIKDLEEATAPISPDVSIGRLSRLDAINNKSVAEAALRTTKKKYASLQLALRSVEKPGFGACGRCKRQINTARLMFLPESTLCVNCAR